MTLTIDADGTIHAGIVTAEDKLRSLQYLFDKRRELNDQIDIILEELTNGNDTGRTSVSDVEKEKRAKRPMHVRSSIL
jgi:hypothetical protein